MLIAFHFPQNILWPFWALIPPRNFLLSLLLPGLLNLSAAFFVCCSLPPSLVGEGETDSVCLYTGQRLPPGRLLQSERGWGGWGAKQRSSSVPVRQKISRQVKMQKHSIQRTKSMLAFWYQHAVPGMQAAPALSDCCCPESGEWQGEKSQCSLTKTLLPFSSWNRVLLTVKSWSKCQNYEKADSVIAFQLLIDSVEDLIFWEDYSELSVIFIKGVVFMFIYTAWILLFLVWIFY